MERESTAVSREVPWQRDGRKDRRDDFLSRASRLLADSLDYETTLATIAGLALPHLGNWCIVDIVEESGAMRRLAIVHPDPRKQTLARRLADGWPPERDDPFGAPLVMLTGRSAIIPQVTEGMLEEAARSPENLRILQELGIGSLLVVPLKVRREVLGAITFVGPQEGHHYTQADQAVAEDLAARAAIAIDNARLYREAQRARQAAEVASRAKSQLLAITSHELRTPINAIMGYAQLLEMGLDGPLTEEQRAKLERIQASSHYLLGLVNQVLDVAKVEAGQLKVEREAAVVGEAVHAALAIVQPSASARGIEIENRCGPAEKAGYLGDSVRVRQILLNLMVNACKFSSRGGQVWVGCETVRGVLPEARLFGVGPWVRIDVHDSGIGIPEEMLTAVFEPFVQVDPELTRDVGGTGLGLTISRRLARLMGGDLTVTSTPGQGSRFSLWLPAADGSAAEAELQQRASKGHEFQLLAHLILERLTQIVDAYVARLRADPAVPEAADASDVELRDHTPNLLSGIASALASIGTAAEPPGDLLRDGNTIQRVIAELHGAQRRRLGWRAEALRQEFASLQAAVVEEIRRAAPPGLDMEPLILVLGRLIEQVQWASSRGWNVAQADEAPEPDPGQFPELAGPRLVVESGEQLDPGEPDW